MINKMNLDVKTFKGIEFPMDRTSLRVTAAELKRFDEDKRKLRTMIMDAKKEFEVKYHIKPTPAYEKMEEICLISVTSLKKTMNGSQHITRNFLYKLAVGLQMSVEEANRFFALCGGVLNEEYMADYICIHALLDHDSIHDFCDQFEKYTGIRIKR